MDDSKESLPRNNVSEAEVTEDIIERGNLINIDDEGYQDWNALSNVESDTKQGIPIPRRGEKDFEPDGTEYQNDLLENSLKGMYKVLDFERGHNVKQKLIGVWLGVEQKVLVPHAKGAFFKDIGMPVNYGKKVHGLHLNGLEAIYLMERGSLLIYDGDDDYDLYLKDDRSDFDYNRLSVLSLSHLYSLVTSTDSRAVEKYQVYSYLKRHGYLVQEYRKLEISSPIRSSRFQLYQSFKGPLMSCFSNFIRYCFASWPIRIFRSIGLLSYPRTNSMHFSTKHYFDYRSIFKSLSLVTSFNFEEKPIESELSLPDLIHFNVWKPLPSFSKKRPPFPDFQVKIVNINRDDFPLMGEIDTFLNSINHCSPFEEEISGRKSYLVPSKYKKGHKKMERRQQRESQLDESTKKHRKYLSLRDDKLKNGSSGKSIVFAIYDNGVISFMTLKEGDFTLRNQYVGDLNEIYPNKSHGIVYL